ncbi:hypothetical protein LCGC14_1524480 [marine sediment metagenome]|uniref:Uncharacterized protein n=1 Tax=marine sediment metagenome TaxID=412755 RepID=A0A0F9IXU1_9ZZZZ
MTDGEKKKFNVDIKSSQFLHRGIWHYSHKGRFVDCVLYHSMADMGLDGPEIFREYGKSIEPIAPRVGQVKIQNIRELMEYMYSIMTDEWVARIKGGIKKGMPAHEVFALFPIAYQWILRLRYLHDKGLWGKVQVQPEVKRGIKTVSKEMILKGE